MARGLNFEAGLDAAHAVEGVIQGAHRQIVATSLCTRGQTLLAQIQEVVASWAVALGQAWRTCSFTLGKRLQLSGAASSS